MKKLIAALIVVLSFYYALAADKGSIHPKLVVGIVIDQMRYDYLYRFYDYYSETGLKKLMKEGMNFKFAQYNYMPTYTGPGHSSIYTGTTPYHHGIISNDWYDKETKKSVYCVHDGNFKGVGSDSKDGESSPSNLLSTTITDELRMSDNGLSRVFSASIKDRASVLPGGHLANAAYWYDGESGKFITSTYYLKSLPEWVAKFNTENYPAKLMSGGWKLYLPDVSYKSAMPDNGAGESDVFKEGKTTFPHDFSKLSNENKIDKIRTTPFGNTLLTDFILDLLKNEKIGEGEFTDFLAISYSSTDYIGHAYGPNSMEVMDTYIRLDGEISRLLESLDRQVGKGNYLLFFTADHAVKPNRAYLEENRINAGALESKTIEDSLSAFCSARFGNGGCIEKVFDNQVYFNHNIINRGKIDLTALTESCVSYLRNNFKMLADIKTKQEMNGLMPTRTMSNFILNGWNPWRSGDIVLQLIPGYLIGDHGNGTSHGSSYDYDTHIPVIFYGWHIPQGESNEEVYIEDIAPTVANLINIQEPSGCIGKPIIKKIK